MKRILLTTTLIVLGFAPLVSRASLLVYEPFNYPVGPLTGQSGGLGFSGGWLAHAGDSSDGGYVYDQTALNVTNANESGAAALSWNGTVNNLPTLPTVGARYQGGKTNNSNVNIYRTLAASAGDMATTNGGVLWLSAVYHWANRNSLGSGIVIGLANGHCYDRGRFWSPTTTSFIGVNGNSGQGVNTWNYRLNALATANAWTAGQFSFTLGGTNALPATTNDLIVVLKYTFCASDIVEASLFTENQTLSEAAFYTNAYFVSATNTIDETQLNTLTICQGRLANAQDEIRIGTTFTDVVTLPPPGPVDIAFSTVTASPTNLFANGTATSTIKVTLTDSLGVPVAGKSVTLASSPGNATISPAGAQTTGAGGVVTFTAKSTVAGTEVFTANDTTDSLFLSQTPSVEFTALFGDANTSTVVASPTNVLANGISNSTITVTVKNAGGLPMSGKSVTLGGNPGIATVSPTGAQVTDSNGQVVFTAKSTTVGTEVFTATNVTDSVVITQTASVEFSPTVADASTSTVVASPLGVYADGSSTSTITVTLKNSTGLPLPGKSVSLSSSPANATINPPGAETTDANGKAVFTASSTAAGGKVFSATNSTDAVLVSQTATVNFVAPGSPIAVNFNFYNVSGGAPIVPDPATLVGPNGGLGQVWNQTNSYSATNLLSSLGLITSVGYTCDASGIWPWGNPTLTMLQSGAAQFGVPGTTTITINGLIPHAYYNIWLASGNCLSSQLSAGTWSTTNRTSSPASQPVSNVSYLNGDTWLYGNNYVFFEYVAADASGRITFSGASDATHRLPVNGFQLVQTTPPTLTIARNASNPGHYDFTWNSKTNKLYNLVSTNDLTAPLSLWPVWNGNANILGTPPTNSLTNITGSGSLRFFAIMERDVPPPLLSQNFEATDGGFFAVGAPNDWAWGTPLSDSGSGFVLTNADGGSTNCWGTSLGYGGVPSGLITAGAESILQSPAIDFTTSTTAKLKFAAAAHAAAGDTIQVLVLNAADNTVLATLPPIAVPANTGWTTIGPLDISAAAGKNAYLQFRFVGTDGSYCGLYIDDVVVTGY